MNKTLEPIGFRVFVVIMKRKDSVGTDVDWRSLLHAKKILLPITFRRQMFCDATFCSI